MMSHRDERITGVGGSTIRDSARISNVTDLRGDDERREVERRSYNERRSESDSLERSGGTRDGRVGVSVILSVRGEEPFVAERVKRARPVAMDTVVTELVVVNDAAAEATHQACQRLSEHIDVYERQRGEGWEAAVRQGIARALGEVILVMDPETRCDPKEFPKVLAPILAGDADVVFATSLQQWGSGCAAFRVEVLENGSGETRDLEAGFPEKLFDERWRIHELGLS